MCSEGYVAKSAILGLPVLIIAVGQLNTSLLGPCYTPAHHELVPGPGFQASASRDEAFASMQVPIVLSLMCTSNHTFLRLVKNSSKFSKIPKNQALTG